MDLDIKVNCSPDRGTHEIIKKLFNNKFRSDVQFEVGGRTIFAHSLVLKMRSVVFERELDELWGKIIKIPINDFRPDIFFQFIRFLYTDECSIENHNGIGLLKLASQYQVITLERQVINLLDNIEWIIRLFEHCVIEGYEIAGRRAEALMGNNSMECLANSQFLSLHPDAVYAVLQLDEVGKDGTEIKIFHALAQWIDNYCSQHNLTLREGRTQFDKHIRIIRFPTMSSDEIRDCKNRYSWLLTETDFYLIEKQIKFGRGSVEKPWISKRRDNDNALFRCSKYDCHEVFETIFEVSHNIILQGIWIGVTETHDEIEIQIKSSDINSSKRDTVKFTQAAPDYWIEMVICFGDSIQLKPNFKYTITIKYLEIADKQIYVSTRVKNLVYNDPENYIHIVQASSNLFEMVFKPIAK